VLDDAGRKAAGDQSQAWLALLGVTP